MQPEHEVTILAGREELSGLLAIPEGARGIVLFAHGSGSGRLSPRNQHVAHEMQKNQLGTLLLDLLTPEEEAVDLQTRHLRFDIPFLAKRLNQAAEWLLSQPETKTFQIGYFGSSTGAAAALYAAVEYPLPALKAIVSRGGRPDLAGSHLSRVLAPTLLIVGSYDFQVLELNHHAYELLRCEKRLDLVARATHLFEESGALEQAAQLASGWFSAHFKKASERGQK